MSQPISKLPVGEIVVDPQTTYHNQPIAWVILNQGNDSCDGTTLLSKYILCLKAFDAKEPDNENVDIQNYGNAFYEKSNLYQWLNSDSVGGAWYTPQHIADQPPDSEYVTCDPYTSEDGFLSGFSDNFKNNILTTHKIITKNRDSMNEYRVCSSKIYLVSLSEINSENGRAYLTADAMNSSSYDFSGFTTNPEWDWWIRPDYDEAYKAPYKAHNGSGYSTRPAYTGECGVRPACQIISTLLVSDTKNSNGYYEIIGGHYVEQEPSGSPTYLTIGGKYLYGGYEWMCAEQLDNNTYVLQSTGMTHSGYPGYILGYSYDGSTVFTRTEDGRKCLDDISYLNVANIDDTIKRWYLQHRSIEAVGGISIQSGTYDNSNRKNGLYLIPFEKIRYDKSYGIGWKSVDESGDSFNAQYSESCYWKAIQVAAENHSTFDAFWGLASLGSIYYNNSVCVYSDGRVSSMDGQMYNAVFAPAFNIDARKIVVNGNEIFPIPIKRFFSRGYIGIDGRAKEIESIYVGVNGVAQKIFEAPSNIIRLGKTYTFGGYEWVAAEQLSENIYAMQSVGMTGGYWPGYYLSTDYNGTADFGNIDTPYSQDINYLNIANYNRITSEWYESYGSAEADGGINTSTGLYDSTNVKNGLYLLPYTKTGVSDSGKVGSGNYYAGLLNARFNSGYGQAWLGTCCWSVTTSNSSQYNYYDGIVNQVSSQAYSTGTIAPVFNIDISKVIIDHYSLTLPVEPDPLPEMHIVYLMVNRDYDKYPGQDLTKHESRRVVANGETYGEFPVPTAVYYECIGWFTDPENGDQITSNSIVQLSDDQTLWAHWERIPYTITFDVNGGNPLPENQTSKIVYYDETYGDLPTPTKSSVYFDEWYANENNEREQSRIDYVFTGWYYNGIQTSQSPVYQPQNHTMKAQWKEVVNGPIINKTYSFGGFNWMLVEKLSDGIYALQSTGMTSGTWPGYKLSSSYNGTSFGDENTEYAGDIIYENVANYDDVTLNWYSEYLTTEASGGIDKSTGTYNSGNTKNGLYLISQTKCGGDYYSSWQRLCNDDAEYDYWKALKIAAHDHKEYGANNWYAMLGDYWMSEFGEYCGWEIFHSGSSMSANTYVQYSYSQNSNDVFAPAFNLDANNVKFIGSVIVSKTFTPDSLAVGLVYGIGSKKWMCAEKLAENIYAMQCCESFGSIKFPGYILNSNDFTDTNCEYLNISSINEDMSTWYLTYGSIEANGGIDSSGSYNVNTQQNGLYLLPSNCFVNMYKNATKDIRSGYDGTVWTGTCSTANWAYAIGDDGLTSCRQSSNSLVAPVFNIDISKITIDSSTHMIYPVNSIG